METEDEVKQWIEKQKLHLVGEKDLVLSNSKIGREIKYLENQILALDNVLTKIDQARAT
jgi:hypothetical protein